MESTPGSVIGPRRIPITTEQFSYANVEAWLNIIRSYHELHPGHEITILYENEAIQNKMMLFKLERPLNLEGFEVTVRVDDGEDKHVTKLIRLLMEGAGPNHERFLRRELFQIQDLF